ncbi:MAG: hypothetical protein K6G30_08860 [Acetatifactor sp.]|nr:hypothetical protein [Acetatifactor sp.]
MSYKGEAYNIKETDNELSLAMLESTVKEIEYSFVQGEEEPNHVRVRII